MENYMDKFKAQIRNFLMYLKNKRKIRQKNIIKMSIK
jgi:hypothetical protein